MKFNVNANCGCCGDGGPFVCTDICETLPASITVTVAGLENDKTWCGSPSVVGDCIDDFNTCLAGCFDCTCECACAATRDACICNEVDAASGDKCVIDCPCANVNGTWVMEPTIEDPCSYVASFEFCEPDYPIWSVGDPPMECPLTDCYTVEIGATLVAKGDGLVEIIFNPPFAHTPASGPAVSWWTSGDVPQADICAGDTFPLDTAPTSGVTVYADECSMGCGCGQDSSFRCGDVQWVCTLDDPDNPTTCADTSQAVDCDFAQHNAITVSDATVSP